MIARDTKGSRLNTVPDRRRHTRTSADGPQRNPRAEPAEYSDMDHGAARKPYHQPRLSSYGAVCELTQFGGSEILDSGGNIGNLP